MSVLIWIQTVRLSDTVPERFLLVKKAWADNNKSMFVFVCLVALRPKSTALVMVGRSVHLTTLFPGQA